MNKLVSCVMTIASVAVLAACGGSSSESTPAASAAPPGTAQTLRAKPAPKPGVLDPRLQKATGPQRIWVSLAEPSVVAFKSTRMRALGVAPQTRSFNSKADTSAQSAAEQAGKAEVAAHRQAVLQRQSEIAGQMQGMGARELARVHLAHNAVAVSVDAGALAAIASLPGVVKVRPVIDYEVMLGEVVPYVGGKAAQAAGRTGKGVRIAIIDSGIDYTHRSFGGAGTREAYVAAHGEARDDPKARTRDGLFPTPKVIGGYDFVGENWPVGPEVPDEDPIDFGGHGSHVADIAAGRSADGTHVGMAPDASLIALKVCSYVGNCSGVGLLQAIDYALDPNGDGDTSDAVDVINMSLSSRRGQIGDDLSLASANAVALGVVIVGSAGNFGDVPYLVGSPSTADGVISVAQTRLPSTKAVSLAIASPASIAGTYSDTLTYTKAPIDGDVSGEVAYFGRGCPAGTAVPPNPADDPVLADVSGKIALIDITDCLAGVKIDYAAKAGARGVLMGYSRPGAVGLNGFGVVGKVLPTLVIPLSLTTSIKERLTAGDKVNVTILGATGISFAGSMATTSARGPSTSTQRIKPEIGAPGAATSAISGSGAGESEFGGTSGAAPVVAGAAALLIEAHPGFSPERIKALLMNSAETGYTNRASLPNEPAPATRIGAGEVRVDRALALTSLATNPAQQSAALAFGALEVDRKTVTAPQMLRIENFAAVAKRFTLKQNFRDPAEAASGAVTMKMPTNVVVPANGSIDVQIALMIDPDKLPSWELLGGFEGGDGAKFNGPEFDGMLTLVAGAEKLSVPWHVLPRRAAATEASWAAAKPGQSALQLVNRGSETGLYDLFSLVGTSPQLPASAQPEPGDEFALIDLRAVGVRQVPESYCGEVGGCIEFALSTYGRRAHPEVTRFDVGIDTDGDGKPDHVVASLPAAGEAGAGQTLVYATRLSTGEITSYFYADVDLNSGSIILTASLAGLGLADGQTIGFGVNAIDNYYNGRITDSVAGMRFTIAGARFAAAGDAFGEVAPRGAARVVVNRSAVPDDKSTESGMLVMHRRNAGTEADVLKAY